VFNVLLSIPVESVTRTEDRHLPQAGRRHQPLCSVVAARLTQALAPWIAPTIGSPPQQSKEQPIISRIPGA
jgi:hypothetical protein